MHQSNAALFVSEFIGTGLLVLLGCGSCANQRLRRSWAYGADWLMISFGWGFAVFVACSIAWKSGAQINPAVTLGLALSGSIEWSLVPMLMTAQVSGAVVGAFLCYMAFKKQFDTQVDRSGLGGIFFTSAAVRSNLWNVITEVIGTFVLVYWVLQSSPFEPGTADSSPVFGNAALGYAAVAFVVISIGASLGGPTGYAINPARDLGPRIAYSLLRISGKASPSWDYAWIPIVGPLLGGAAAAGLFAVVGA